MKRNLIISLVAMLSLQTWGADKLQAPMLFPDNGATEVNVDTHLKLTFNEAPQVGTKGKICVYDAETGEQIDCIDMSIPAGPVEGQPRNPAAQYTPVPYVYTDPVIPVTNKTTKAGTPSGQNQPDATLGQYQLTIIGGFSDGFHFHPIITHDRQATIYLHHNLLDYDHEYYVTIDKGVIEGFDGIKGKKGWRFRTKAKAPDRQKRQLTVAADGTADFSTLQGAMDYIPNFTKSEKHRWRVFVKNGDYEELVYFRNKDYVTIEGESRDGVRIHYPNNEVFNPHPADIKTNEWPGTFPSRRAAVAADNCHWLVLKNLTLQTDCKGQAEGFLINGEYNYCENLHIIGSGDALQANGSCYWLNCQIDGDGDTILGRGPSFFRGCTINSYGAFMWIRNTEKSHGNVFLDCIFRGLGSDAVIARLPDNKGQNYPHAECVLLNCQLEGIPQEGFGPVDEGAKTARLWEYNSHQADGKPMDVSKRYPLVQQLNSKADSLQIAQYRNYRYVLNWSNGGTLTPIADDPSLARVKISTSMGDIIVRLYDETPLHRQNFLRLVKEGYYDGTLFHRVIENFMIQGGDPDSKGAAPGIELGNGGPGYTVEAEFRPWLLHRRGALAAAREGDDVNPEKRSGGSQFYIVWGKNEQGTPHLNGDYTVFGYVEEGLDVVERIQQAKTDGMDRPLEDIVVNKMTVM